ncbi:MAG: alpha/beta fold hydrolase [Kineosporiaceae bacterium]
MFRRVGWATGVAVLSGLLLRRSGLWSDGEPFPLTGRDGSPIPGSLAEKVRVDINGVPQGMFIRSRDPSHPVLLYVHGGLPEYFLTERYPQRLEDDFTVAWWEQRGAGLSASPEIPAETLTVEQLIADTLAVTDYLGDRFGQPKIYLLGHSGGSFIALQAAARASEKYHAYIGMAQMVNQLCSEVLAYEYMLRRFREIGDDRMVPRLEAAPVTMSGGTPPAYLKVRDRAMHRLGVGTTHEMTSVVTGIVWPSLRSRQYTAREKVALWRAKATSGVSALWTEMLSTDLAERVPRLGLPVYLLHGVHDYTCSYDLARAYAQRVEAPIKGFYTFTDSAHTPVFEEPDRGRRIMREDVLARTNHLADRLT